MILRIALFVMMALGLAGFGTVAWLSTRPPPAPAPVAQAAPVPPPHVSVLAVGRMLRPGNLLKPEDLVPLDMLATATPANTTIDTPAARAALVGAMVRRTMMPNQTVLPDDVLRPGDHGFLAAVLAPGMRATSVAVDAVTGTAGLIWPGDHVDLLLTQSLDDQSLPLAHRIAGETVLTDVRVIAIDQQLSQGTAPNGSEPQPARTVTLEVTSAQAERVAVASRLGHLTLVVRPADMAAAAQPAGVAVAANAAAPASGVAGMAGLPTQGAPASAAATPGAVTPSTPAKGAMALSALAHGATAQGAPAASPALPVPAAASTVAAAPGIANATPAAPATAVAADSRPGITWGGDVSAALDAGRKNGASSTNTMRVFEGNADGKEFHF